MCKAFNCLPYEGGLMNQPGAAILRIQKVLEAQGELDAAEEEFRKSQRGKNV